VIAASGLTPVRQRRPARALAETVLGGAALQALLWALAPQLSDYALVQGGLFINLACGWWCAVRLGPVAGLRSRRWLILASVSVGLGLALGATTLALAFVLGQGARWQQSNPDAAWAAFYLVAAGPAFLAWRGVLRFWHYWNRLRRQHMSWAITHANLVVIAACTAVVIAVFILRQGTFSPETARGPVAFAVTLLTNVILPVFSLAALATVLALILLLPPAALFSYRLARRTTWRLQALVAATSAARAGAVPAQVPVTGEDEVAELQKDFNGMAADLDRVLAELKAERDNVTLLLDARRKLIASVSHELRTPVATLRGYLELVMSDEEQAGGAPEGGTLAAGAPATGAPGTSARERDLAAMERELARLETLIDDLFTLARSDAGGLGLQCRPCDVGLLASQAVETVAPLAWRSARVKVTAQVSRDVPDALVDPARLSQVLANLLRNAVRHTPPGGIVMVEVCGPEDGFVVARVVDTGEGISPDDLPHVWERFYRGAGGREGEGTGLGLAVVKDLVEAMGGKVAAESTPGQGACFTISLPPVPPAG
jgi:signal transduction histidine kinase